MEINEVYKMRRSIDTDVAIAPNLQFKDLKNMGYCEIVDMFEKRILDRYFKIAEAIIERAEVRGEEDWSGGNFTVTILCCVILDLLSQYVYAAPVSMKDVFKKFFRNWLPELNHKIDPKIKTCYFAQGKWVEETISDVADGFYHCFRCGIVHSGRILEYGRINPRYPEEIIKVIPGADDKTAALLKKLRQTFLDYVQKLKDGDRELKANFKKKFIIEYGIDVREQ